MRYPAAIQRLVDAFALLPTVGPKTAERFALHLLSQPPGQLKELAEAISQLKERVTTCRSCFALAEHDPCPICASPARDGGQLCVVSSQRDFLTIEASNHYRGRYFVLAGELNQLEGVGPSALNLEPLMAKVKSGAVKEIILALNPTIEGETTAMYLARLLKGAPVKLTRLARGLPMGATLEYADELTLTNALKYRNEI